LPLASFSFLMLAGFLRREDDDGRAAGAGSSSSLSMISEITSRAGIV